MSLIDLRLEAEKKLENGVHHGEELNIYSGDQDRDSLVKAALDRIGPNKPVVIVNLLRFRKEADYSDLTATLSPVVQDISNPCSGEEAYFDRYIPAYNHICSEWFGKDHDCSPRILYAGKDMMPLLNLGRLPSSGEHGDQNYWHGISILRYPSLERAIEFENSDEYWQANYHRAAALEDNVLWVSGPREMPR